MTKKSCPLGEDCDLTIAWMKGAEDARDKAKARIEALEAKLAKATHALRGVRDFVRDLEPYADQGHTLAPALHDACMTLRELEGANK